MFYTPNYIDVSLNYKLKHYSKKGHIYLTVYLKKMRITLIRCDVVNRIVLIYCIIYMFTILRWTVYEQFVAICNNFV